ncbi:unnamed protein product, partial [Amoebophrya sp. A25]
SNKLYPVLFVFLLLAMAFPCLVGFPTLEFQQFTPTHYDFGSGPQHVGACYYINDNDNISREIYTPRDY